MPAVAFDTLKLADRLQAGGFTPEQARTAAAAFADAMSASDLATKADLRELELRLEAKLSGSESRLETKIEASKADLLKWMFGAIVVNAAVVLGGMVGLAKLLGH
ncbi:MAG: hypothetical protein GC191_09375 [Azospirillum sp.]|nr:hypothetical protein [Azospirillum sp.]